MIAYVAINIAIIILALLLLGLKEDSKPLNLKRNKNELLENLFMTISFFILWLIAGFRGDFTADYRSYSDLFHYYNNFTLIEIFNMNFYEEIGYVILNKLIGIFTDNEIYFMLIISYVILQIFYREFKKNSSYIWLSILLFINIGAFYTSFNIMRQILAASIIFSGSKYLYERRFYKYLLIVVIATLFHKTSLLMLPFYFILNFRFNIKNVILIIITAFISGFFVDKIVEIIQSYWYTGYTYGMSGLNYTSAVVPLSILIFVLLHSKLLDAQKTMENIWINTVVFYAFFSVIGLKVQMLQRFSEFFGPFVLLIIPYIISKIRDKNLRVIYLLTITILLIAYNYITLSGTGYDPYYFIWDVK